MPKNYRPNDIRFMLDKDWKWSCIDTDKFVGTFAEFLQTLGIESIPDNCQFMRIKEINRTIVFRAYGAYLVITIYNT